MARVKLTAGRIERFALPADTDQAFLWDADTKQLAVRVSTGGKKAYIFQSRLTGRSLRDTIGGIDSWSIDRAREEARRLQTLVDKGIDPRQMRKQQDAATEAATKAEQHKDLTVGEAWGAYIEARTPKWGARHLLNHRNMAKPGGAKRTRGRRVGESATIQPGPLHSLLRMHLSDLDADAVRAWLAPLAARTPTQAAQTYRALRAFIAWCADHKDYKGLAHVDSCNRRLAKDVLPKAKAKTDCLQREQLKGWFAAVRAMDNPVIAAYLQTLLLIGSRREELAGLKWEDVDFRCQSITIRDKVEGMRTIPLTPYVAALLAALPRRNGWMFSSLTAKSGRLQEPRINHNKACAVAGIEGLTLHGLRRSFGTLTEWVECPAGVVAQIMGHKPSATAEKHYKVRPLDLLRMWHTKLETWILEQAGIPQPAENFESLRVVTANSKKAIQ